ncbi:nucleolus protein [Daedaleopsis nitida]|nr:nucleolus protein [Daedaleopsis nitida]
MPKTRKNKRKAPVTSPARPSDRSCQPSGSSYRPQATRTVIRRFHVLLKRQGQLQRVIQDAKQHAKAETLSAQNELSSVEEEIEALGGLAAYQRMSTIGQGKDRGGGSEKVLIAWMRELKLPEEVNACKTPLHLLEVGALKPDNYASCGAWLDVTPIDLHSQHPSILEQDFLLMDIEEHRGKWDVISLSLVLNFPPNPTDRGQMLRIAHDLLQPQGLLFVALPLPCIMNSRFMTPDHFEGLMKFVGFDQIRTHWKDGGKMAYWLFRQTLRPISTTYQEHELYQKKAVFRQGNRNNFLILL